MSAITVGAADDHGTADRIDDTMAAFSNKGPRADDGDSDPYDEKKPEVTAPGVNITSAKWNTVTSYGEASDGTSMAAAHVSGVAALILQKYQSMNAGSVGDLIIRTAEDRSTAGWNNDWGYGYIDAFAALDAPRTSDVEFPNHGFLPNGFLRTLPLAPH